MSTEKGEHFVGMIAQKAIIQKGNSVLITRDSRDIDHWELPGGRLNHGEDPKDGLLRELIEELGTECVIGKVIHVGQFFHPRAQQHHALIVYHAQLVDSDKGFDPDLNEVAEAKWITSNELESYRLFEPYNTILRAFFKDQQL